MVLVVSRETTYNYHTIVGEFTRVGARLEIPQAGVGEVEPAVGAEGQVVRHPQRHAVDLGRDGLDLAVGRDALDRAGQQLVRAPVADDAAVLRDVEAAVRAEAHGVRAAARVGQAAHALARRPDRHLAAVRLDERDAPVVEYRRPLRPDQALGEALDLHAVPSSAWIRSTACSSTATSSAVHSRGPRL